MMKQTVKKYQPVKYYFIAGPSFWPLMGSIGLFCTVLGLVQTLHHSSLGPFLMVVGVGFLVTTMVGWFGRVINESISGLHSEQMDRTYRWAMIWFIVSEISLFSVFFGALFYTRLFTIMDLSGSAYDFAKLLVLTKGPATHHYLWPNFQANWPLLVNPNPQLYPGPSGVVEAWGIPALNTFLLLSSAVTVTIAHWGLKQNNRRKLLVGLAFTIGLGLIFEMCQAHEYMEAYNELGLTLHSGIFGSTFFTLTGLHAMHVCVGIAMLSVIFVRCLKGHFLPEHHFAFEAVSWYWHFVDVVWLFLFIFVYWL